MTAGQLRKVTVFDPCERHAPMYAAETRYRRAEVMGEGGYAHSPCPGATAMPDAGCKMKPGTDLFARDFVAANPVYYVGADAADIGPQCPRGHGRMIPRPVSAMTKEQAWCGAWYDCPPGPPGEHCASSVLVPSPELIAHLGAAPQ